MDLGGLLLEAQRPLRRLLNLSFHGGWNEVIAAVMERKRQIKTFQSGQILMMWGGEVREREVSRLILQVSGMAAWVEGGYF